MSPYIFGRIKKESLYALLTAEESRFAILYKDDFPEKENAIEVWHEKIQFIDEQNSYSEKSLTQQESVAIVNWIYNILNNSDERENFTKELFKRIKDIQGIDNDIRFKNGVFYNKSKVEIHFLSTVSTVNNFVSKLRNKTEHLFYRGHSNANYILLPSVMRTSKLQYNENRLYNDILIECPDDFKNCDTHLEKLVKMQHYGLPTRLLDITRNPLVALYFACEDNFESYGELVLFSSADNEIKYPQSDTISILASLPAFTKEKQQKFLESAKDFSISKEQFNSKISRLIHEVRLEKPAFLAEVKKDDLLNNFIVYALKNNNRIIKQDGAFILCGLSAQEGSLNNFRYQKAGKKVVVLIDNKQQILEQLNGFSINRASLFPEIECVADFLKDKYNK